MNKKRWLMTTALALGTITAPTILESAGIVVPPLAGSAAAHLFELRDPPDVPLGQIVCFRDDGTPLGPCQF